MPTNYEPSDEIRVFSGGEDDEDVEGSRLPLLIVIALLVLAAFGGVVWLAYQRGVQQGHTEVPRVIAAEPGPAKVPPTSAGGTPTPYTGLKIYQQPAPANDESDAASVAPAPSQPLATKPAPSAATAAPTVRPTVNDQAKPTPIITKPAPARPAPAVVAIESKPVLLPAPQSAAPAATPAATGGSLLQIGSYKSEADANAAWTVYKAKHATLLAGLSPDVKQVDLGAKGTWYRLRIVAGDKSSAVALCDKLKAEGALCIPAK
jgi:cell division protein FtsN